MRIESFTDEQIALLPKYAEEWGRIGLNTDPADRPRAEAAIRWMYAREGIAPPRIVWCGGPLSQFIVRSVILEIEGSVQLSARESVRHSVRDSVRDSARGFVQESVRESVQDAVWDSVRNSVQAAVWHSVRESVQDAVWDFVRDSVRDSVQRSGWGYVRDSVQRSGWGSVRNSVRDSVWDSVRDSVWDSMQSSVRDSVLESARESARNSVWHSVRNSIWDPFGGQHEADWLVFYKVFDDLGLVFTRPLEGLWELCKSAGWLLSHKNICWVSERHTTVKADDLGRLHCSNGPAISWPDTWAIYMWRGVVVPRSWIDGPLPQATEVLEESNIERRRAGCEIIGWESILQQIGSRLIDRNEDPHIGELIEADLPDAPEQRFLRCLCGTGREFIIHVAPSCSSALEANAWTYNFKLSDIWKPETRT